MSDDFRVGDVVICVSSERNPSKHGLPDYEQPPVKGEFYRVIAIYYGHSCAQTKRSVLCLSVAGLSSWPYPGFHERFFKKLPPSRRRVHGSHPSLSASQNKGACLMWFRPKLDGTYTPEQLVMIEAARALADTKRDLLRSLARRQAARPARQEAARIGAQTRKGRKA